MRTHLKLATSLFVLIGLVAAACGSTVPSAQQSALESAAPDASDDLSDLPEALPEGAHVNKKGQVVSKEGEVLGDASDFGLSDSGSSSSQGSTGSTGGEAPNNPGTAVSGEMGPGITDDTIKIGVSYADDAEEANSALGASGATQINTRQAYEAMLKYVNEQGGVAGRKLVPVFYRLSVTSTEPYDQQDQEVCAKWTDDEPVFVSDGGFKTENGIACFQENGMVTIASNGLRFKSADFFERYPTYLEPDGVDNDSIALMYADHMYDMGLFDEGYRLGIITWDDPEYANPTKNTLIPRLEAHGIEVADVTYITAAESGGETAGPVAEIGNAAVRYKGENITHVMFMDSGAGLAFFFMQTAQRQQYFPRYGLTSASGNTALTTITGRPREREEAAEQLKDALSVGWLPTLDVRAEDVPAWGNPKEKEICYEQMREGGVAMESANAKALAELVCNSVWTIKSTIEAAGPVINQETWYRALGRSSGLPLTLGMGFRISPSRRDAVELAARLKFYDDCICFKYVSERFRIPD